VIEGGAIAEGYMAEGGRPLRDLMVQLLATVMIPVTVAGTGLYYTRWQQNLNDLKTMIDLVSDQTPEKRKYGVAMFEYLLKNDKVPVEFVAAQLAYANSSADKELLPLMEQALLKASAENANAAENFRLALERMPSRIFVHAMNDAQRNCLRALMGKVKDTDRTNITIPGYARATWNGERHELRVFRETDRERGAELVKILNDAGLRVGVADLSGNAETANKARPNTFELWFGRAELPASCNV
jgi:predicted transcriptional regulator